MEHTGDVESGLKRLESKHRDLSARLDELQGRRFLTDEEQLEAVNLKKLKLSLKDQMEALARRA